MANKRARRGRGEGTIGFHAASGLWRACTPRIGGKCRTFYGRTKSEALAKLAEHDPAAAPVSRVTVADFLDQWLTMTTVQPSTLRRYRFHVARIARHVGHVELGKLSAYHVQAMYTALADKSPRERQHCGIVLGIAMKQAVELNLIPSNPVRDLPKPRVPKKVMSVWTAEQARRFLDAARPSRMYPLYALALATGMRMGELFGLRRADLSLDAAEPYLTVQRTLEDLAGKPTRLKEPKTAAARRRVLLPAFAVAALREHLRAQLAAGFAGAETIFTNAAGNYCIQGDERRRFRRLVRAAGVPTIRFHDLRHTAATLLLAAGEHVKVVSERLGHASVQITMDTYAHVLPTMQAAAVGRIEAALA
jgi:integrase